MTSHFSSCAQRYAAGRKDSGVHEIKAPDSTRLKVYCNYDNSTGWTMVFKSVSGVAQSPGSSELWASISLLETPLALSFLNGRAHYKNRLVEQWDAFKPNKIRLSIYKNSKEVVKVVFNGIGSNKNNWFAVDRVLSSPWTDLILSSVPKNFFSIPGDRPSDRIRSFMMNSGYGGCENDNGWIVMVEKKGGCDWENLAEFAMVYSLLSTRATYHVTVFADDASVQGRNSDLTFGNYVQHQNSLLSGTPLKKYNVQSVYDCLSACSSNAPCVSINVNTTRVGEGLFECVLLDFDKYQNEGNFSAVKGIDHYTLPVSAPFRM
ncbi:hypothetical protein AC249_AIPGENE2077 [Exaiptasia diaphana]|nr:hypothetical protein AC249_AIPGENE2077 [Exaiptasia diaphana]